MGYVDSMVYGDDALRNKWCCGRLEGKVERVVRG